MTEEQINLVQDAWDKIAPHSQAFFADMYQALFRLDPTLEPLFQLPLEVRAQKLAFTLNAIITSLSNFDEIRFVLLRLGAQHVKFGTRVEHFPILKLALIETLQKYLAGDFTARQAQAWSDAYELIAAVLIEGMEKERQRQTV
ncbi:globin domain-containing protein [Chitinibacter sp. S2-10]|uniref:globin domain-containing protein n=1 Tax=Chitinibacter sp. S2-10 TaxID=3373597 RepID=UPI003977D024